MPTEMRRKEGAVVPRWAGRPFVIFAADPGGTTGCASAQWEPASPDDQLTSIEQIKFRQWQISERPHHVQLWAALSANPYTQYVWETFEFRQHVYTDKEGNQRSSKNKVELISREYIGVMELYCALNDAPHYTLNASAAKHFITNEKIVQLGLWLPGMKDAMDATRHLLRYMFVKKKIQTPFADIWLADD
jgi:hypothetical protein